MFNIKSKILIWIMYFRCVSVGLLIVINVLVWDFDDRGGCTRMCRGYMGILYFFNFIGDLRMFWGKKKFV